MAVNYTRQYRPVSTRETSQADCLSIRAIRDIADGINNFKGCVGNHPIICEMFTADSNRVLESQSYDEWGGSTGDLGDYLTPIAVFAPRYWPDGYDYFTVQCCANVPSDYSGTARFELYLFDKKYVDLGPGLFSPNGYNYSYARWDVDGSIAYQFFTVSSTEVNFSNQYVYPVLVSDHNPASGNMPRGSIKSLVVRPMVSSRI